LGEQKIQFIHSDSNPKVQNLIILFFVLSSVILGVVYRFIQDDAFISFIYARNLIRGNGLTWFGNYVEGYTNFLWVIWIAFGFVLSIEPVLWSQITGITFFALTIFFSLKISFKIFKSLIPVLLTGILLITNYTMVCFATGGLETMLQTFFITLLVFLFFEFKSSDESKIKRILIIVSLISSLAILTRLDSIVPISVIFISVLYRLFKEKKKVDYYFLLLLPFIVIVGIWFIWKLYYYGSLLPNSYYIKLNDKVLFSASGIKFIYRFFHWYLIWPFVLIGIIYHIIRKKKFGEYLVSIMLILIVWILYILYTGGDFMEFRFFVPVLPILFVFISFLIYNTASGFSRPINGIFIIISLIILISSSILHSKSFKDITNDSYLDSIDALSTFYGVYPDNNWDRIGNALKNEFTNNDVILALNSVGAIVYYSEINTVDLLGLNSKNISENYRLKENVSPRPGHRMIAKIEYLISKKVNFIIGHPYVALKGTLANPGIEMVLQKWLVSIINVKTFPFNEISFVGIPIGDKEILIMVYLTRTPELDKLIQDKRYEHLVIKLSNN
jgi:arabinofuranosyltransferase